jgi:ribonuclease P/MRP protein subunit RPP1
MKFYDFNIKGTNYQNDLTLLNQANNLGWDYLKLIYSQDSYYNALKYKNELMEEIDKLSLNIKFDYGLQINTHNPEELRKITKKNRDKINYISAFGGNLKINRSALENRQLDVLSRPYYKSRDCGINHVLAKLAFDNDIAIELSLKDILTNHLSFRAKVIAHFKEILLLHRKYKFPLLLTSGATGIYDTKSSRDFCAIFKSIGFSEEEIIKGLYDYPEHILQFNKDRKNMIIFGVKKVGDEDEA